MSESIKTLRDEMQLRGHIPEHCAWFKTTEDDSLNDFMALMTGFAAVGAGGVPIPAIPIIKDDDVYPDLHEVKKISHHVAVAVCDDAVEIWSTTQNHQLDKLVLTYSRGTFRGHLNHYPERVDLTLDNKTNGRITVTGRWVVRVHGCLETARAAVALATGPA